MEKDDGTAQFAKDASFKVKFSGGGSLTLESIGLPGHLLRHRASAVSLELSEQAAAFKADASYFRVPIDGR